MPQSRVSGKWQVVAIVGVGLIGGSVGGAIRQRKLAEQVIGIGHNEHELEWARHRGWLDTWTTSLAEGVRQAELTVVCVPVDQIANCILEAAQHMPANSLITDVGSTKRNIVVAVEGKLPGWVEYVPAHPLAGSEKSGPYHADPDLFVQRQVIVTPTRSNTSAGLLRIRNFWTALGSTVQQMSAEEHDRMAAAISHLPHLLAAALVRATPRQWLPFAASGFRDTTRVAAGDPRLWTAILLANREAVQQALELWEQQIVMVRRLLEAPDGPGLQQWLAQAQQVRHALGSGNPTNRT
ncbi:MAG: prephenate dehydrogenase [Gemmataceae bacterium]|nr:prephenate dehydrogenase [Gemmataceae bacterium]